MRIVALDLEIINKIGEEYSRDRPWELGVGVACTYNPVDGFRDWFGGEDAPDWERKEIRDLVVYLQDFDRVVTFNGVKFNVDAGRPGKMWAWCLVPPGCSPATLSEEGRKTTAWPPWNVARAKAHTGTRPARPTSAPRP